MTQFCQEGETDIYLIKTYHRALKLHDLKEQSLVLFFPPSPELSYQALLGFQVSGSRFFFFPGFTSKLATKSPPPKALPRPSH